MAYSLCGECLCENPAVGRDVDVAKPRSCGVGVPFIGQVDLGGTVAQRETKKQFKRSHKSRERLVQRQRKKHFR